jgi:hypothetical protein
MRLLRPLLRGAPGELQRRRAKAVLRTRTRPKASQRDPGDPCMDHCGGAGPRSTRRHKPNRPLRQGASTRLRPATESLGRSTVTYEAKAPASRKPQRRPVPISILQSYSSFRDYDTPLCRNTLVLGPIAQSEKDKGKCVVVIVEAPPLRGKGPVRGLRPFARWLRNSQKCDAWVFVLRW